MELVWNKIEDNEQIKAECSGYRDGLVRSTCGGWTMLPTTAALVPTIAKMEVRPSDVWIVTYPKCGTTWSQEMIWQVANKVDLEGGKVDLHERFPFLEFETLIDFPLIIPGLRGRITSLFFNAIQWWGGLQWYNPYSWLGFNSLVEKLAAIPASQKRFIKSHLPLSLLPTNLVETAKVIFVARNPRDVMVSYYHHHKLIKGHGYVGDLPNFAKRFKDNQIMMGPFFPYIEEGWNLKDHPNFLFIFFEDMKKDMKSVLEKVSKFLESPLSDEQVETLVDHLDIKNFRNNSAVNQEYGKELGFMEKEGNFIRKGEVGGWKKEFEKFPEMEKIFNTWVEESLANSNVEFPESKKQ